MTYKPIEEYGMIGDLEIEDGAAVGEITLAADETADFILEATDPDQPSPADADDGVDKAFEGTVAFWRRWGSRIRDASLTTAMLVRLGYEDEPRAFLDALEALDVAHR